MSVRNSFCYSVFGLRVRSEIELPELIETETMAPVDVQIALGTVNMGGDTPSEITIDDEGVCLSIGGIAHYYVSGGSRIVMDPRPGVPMRNVRLYLLGSAMGLLLHQRGHLPLHANAVKIGDGAFAFIGRSGAGKSTLAAALHDRGHRVIADDVCVIQFAEGGKALACPGIPRLRLWEAALEASGRNPAAFERSYIDELGVGKFDVPLARTKVIEEPVPLGALFLLADGDQTALSPMSGLEAAEAIYANTYRGRYAAVSGTVRNHWQACVGLLRVTPLFRFQRRLDMRDFDMQCTQLLGFIDELEEGR